MTIAEIRRKNLLHWCNLYTRQVVAEKVGYPNTVYINQLCGGLCDMGSRTARRLEKALDLAEGDFDQWIDSGDDIAVNIPAYDVELVKKASQLYALWTDKSADPDTRMDAYEQHNRLNSRLGRLLCKLVSDKLLLSQLPGDQSK